MRSWRTGLIAGIGVLGFSTLAQVRLPAVAQTEPTWRTDFSAAASEARSTGKPLFVAFR